MLAVLAGLFGGQASHNAELAATREAEALVNAEQAATSAADARSNSALAATREADAVQSASVAATRRAEAQAEANLRATAELQAVAGQQAAEEQARLATSRELAAEALSSLDLDPELGALLALEALARARTLEAENALHQAIALLRLLYTFAGHLNVVSDLAVSPGGALLATASHDATVRLWDLDAGGELLAFKHPHGTNCVAFDPQGTHLATCGRDGVLIVWHLFWNEPSAGGPISVTQSYSVTLTTRPLSDAVFSPDSRRLAAASADATAWLLDALSGEVQFTLTGHQVNHSVTRPWATGVAALAFSPDGQTVATAGLDGTARLWDAATGREELVLAAHTGRVWDVAFAPDGLTLATAGADALARLWDALSGTALMTLTGHADVVSAVAFHPEEPTLATASRDGTVRLWDTATGEEQTRLSCDSALLDLDISLGGARLASSGMDGVTRVWDLALPGAGQWDGPPQLRLTLGGQGEAVTRIAFSPDGLRLAAASLDGVVRIWDSASGQELLSLSSHEKRLTGVAFSPDGSRLATSGTGQTHIYALQIDELVALARARLRRTLTDEECRHYLHLDRCPPAP